MKKIFVALLLAGFLAVPALHAEEANPEARANAEALIQVLRIPDSTSINIERVVMNAIQQQPEIVVFQDTLTQFYEKYLGYEALKEEFIAGFVANFTPEELDELVEFYSSPVGAKSVALTGSISALVFQGGYERAEQNVAELQRMVDQKAEILSGK